MSRKVLLVEPDVDLLGQLASELRGWGITVSIADGASRAVERARSFRPDVLLLSKGISSDPEMVTSLITERTLVDLPRYVLVVSGEGVELGRDEVPYSDVPGIAKRVLSVQARSIPAAAESEDFRGDLKQVSMGDLLQLLSMNQRTGTLTITTARGAGEVRLVDGQIADAVFRRAEGEKALFRLFAETDGSFVFAAGLPTPYRRVSTSTAVLLLEGSRRLDEVRQKQARLAARGDALVSIIPPSPDSGELGIRLSDSLASPRTLEEILDDVPHGDLEILDALDELMRAGSVRRITGGAMTVELASEERLQMLSALVKRIGRSGFDPSARLVVIGPPPRLTALTHSVRRIRDALAPAESVPAAPVPHRLATLRLTEGVEVEIVGLPSLSAYMPLWGLAFPGSAAAVALEAEATAAAEQLSSVFGVPILEVPVLMGECDEADPAQVAALICTVLEATAGQ